MLTRTSILMECALEISGKVADRSPFTLHKSFIFYVKVFENVYFNIAKQCN